MVRDARKSALLTMRKRYLSIDALDPCDDGFGAQLGDNSAEMLQVIDLKIDGQLGEIRRAPEHADVVDIAVVLGDHGGDLGEASGLVDVIDEDSRRKALRRRIIDIPAHNEPALRLLLEILQRWRLDRIDRDALAGRNDPDDPVARHRPAVWRELDRQIGIDATNRNSRRAARRVRRRFQLQLDRETLLGAEPPDAFFLSLIHISEPTRRTPISYAVFC